MADSRGANDQPESHRYTNYLASVLLSIGVFMNIVYAVPTFVLISHFLCFCDGVALPPESPERIVY